MASIFTFDPDPPRVSSPWAAATPPPGRSPKNPLPQDAAVSSSVQGMNDGRIGVLGSNLPTVDYSSVTRLEAEPQEGPTEYKLHLLLRRRRSFTLSSTKRHVSGSLRRNEPSASVPVSRSVSDSGLLSSTPPPLSSTQSRQHRLEQLTTQMLWRLQQSCPYHTSSSNAGVLPHLPDEAQLTDPITPNRLYPGLEESKGALYEIGVADDGELVGLAEDEMEESLNNLRAMAASLGCHVEVQRMVTVGDCEWVENAGTLQPKAQKSKLLVAEAFIQPDQHLVEGGDAKHSLKDSTDPTGKVPLPNVEMDSFQRTEQLRVSLTGATMSGKSTLLGTLSTGTLDNGRGKSRLSLLKHRHEIESGITSSITQELIGYQDIIDSEGFRSLTRVINYDSTDVSSWLDIHGFAGNANAGRLVFLTDSAGHPRFRRTTVRGLVGWDPHYTFLCIPADNTEDSPGKVGASPSTKEILGSGAAELDFSHEHLQLCLGLELPLVIVITKYDLATKAGLKSVLSKVLNTLRGAGRKGSIIAEPSTSVSEAHLDVVNDHDLLEADRIGQTLRTSPLSVVPIVLTSAVNGSGLGKLHAFLRELPVPQVPTAPRTSPRTLFQIEDSYVKKPTRSGEPIIVGGLLRYGSLSVGDELILGPYPLDTNSDDSDSGSGRASSRNSPVPASRSFPGALHKRSATTLQSRSDASTEWRRIRITSLRNLRLPVRTLYGGQVGTVGIAPIDARISSPAIDRISRGMVLANPESKPKAHRIISVHFTGANAQAAGSLSIGSTVNVYVASIRSTSKVVSVSPVSNTSTDKALTQINADNDEDDGFGFGFDEDGADEDPLAGDAGGSVASAETIVTFQFLTSREFVEVDAKVLVMPGGGPGHTGHTERGEKGVARLQGFVGRVVEDHS